VTDVSEKTGAEILGTFLDEQINSLVEVMPIIRDSSLPRVHRLFPLISSATEDAISIRILGNASRTNQAYVIARALVERTINVCYLLFCTDQEFSDFVDYSLNKAGRRADRTIEIDGDVKVRIALKDSNVEFPESVRKAIAKFTSERGREKTRWTNVSLPERAAAVESRIQHSGLFVPLVTIYADASEALHGTLYGAAFHLGAYDFGAVPNDQESLDRHRHQTLSFLYLMSGGLIDTMFKAMATAGEGACVLRSAASIVKLRKVAKLCGLA
jgi:hypothetical protein